MTSATGDLDVHTEHCCKRHGCKYGVAITCTVYLGPKEQSFPCEVCDEEERDPYVRILKTELTELRRDSLLLGILENYGVDNWAGWSDALDAFRSEEKRNGR